MRLAVIGSAGRKEDAPLVSLELYGKMYQRLTWYVERWKITQTVSGGAAFADHLAVKAYLEGLVGGLVLYLPANFENGAFIPNPRVRYNPGDTANRLHRKFTETTGVDGLAQIEQAIRKGAEVQVFEGFHTRNCEVATHCDYLLAYTFGTRTLIDIQSADPAFNNHRKAGVKDGGTAHTYTETWNVHAKAHESLFDLREGLV